MSYDFSVCDVILSVIIMCTCSSLCWTGSKDLLMTCVSGHLPSPLLSRRWFSYMSLEQAAKWMNILPKMFNPKVEAGL